ncbi:hypothetical protein [Ewingella americana]|jgi:hypothetical protein|uniref:hypothetical protein n=1 Tax=Ewingella americana TaxID=41202 RepID=UPI001639F857|nr:hypothetical protein [Ewingella americana]QMV54162.1 hypothetical protein GXP68_23080 [Ewingella americana]
MNHFSEVTILTSSALYVQQLQLLNEKPKKQTRVIHRDIRASEINPQMKALGGLIADCGRKGKPVRVPAMRACDLGQVLRALELNKAFA